MAIAVTSKLYFAVTFPPTAHVSRDRLSRLARRQLRDLDVIETIDHLFKCSRCFNNYRHIYKSLISHPA